MKTKVMVRILCIVLAVIMVGGLLTSALLSIMANRPVAEEEHDHDHEHTVQMVTLP